MKFTGLLRAATAATFLIASASASFAAEFEVKMLNTGEKGAMVFEPDLIMAAPGDTINFVSVDAGHNVETIKKMFPEGAEKFKSKPSKDFSVTLDVEGVYGLRCTPHYGLGMVMLVVVGEATNLAEVQEVRTPKKAKARLAPLFEELNAM